MSFKRKSESIQCSIFLYSNRDIMITKMKGIEANLGASNSMNLYPEWDVLQYLKNERKELTIEQNMTRVASHQYDLVYNTSKIPIPSQLNIQANEFVTKALKQLAPKPYFPIHPYTIVQLNHMPLIPYDDKIFLRLYTNNT